MRVRTCTTICTPAIAIVAVVATGLAARAHAAPRQDACKSTSKAALRSCKEGAQSDRWLGLGKCANAADATARQACNRQAAADARDALTSCKEQADAREAACMRLGQAPYAPAIDPASFAGPIDNPFFPLVPGTTFVYEGQTAQGFEHDEFAVTRNTRTILGVTCVEVHDTSTLDGVPSEDTLDWFAQDRDGNVWYFGENSKQLEGGLVVGVEGSWTAGVDGAQPGIVMEAHSTIGDFYRQEFRLGVAEDIAEVQSLSESVTVSAGSFDHCLETKETSPLEPDALENKFYAAGTGNVLTIDVTTGERSELVAIRTE